MSITEMLLTQCLLTVTLQVMLFLLQRGKKEDDLTALQKGNVCETRTAQLVLH